ncbi:extracellular solute-binding protein [Bifidobacterium cuniculi]|uniref:ABC transporter, solute-binding protein n=1 Tax=Bifidobacterium cuniculi TaxID=1688 RepID=A0A087B563_9BIFI|nr:extracellular solute-binding protein [Bifidobacterium cuniculi]KFI66163.1 ABC transporter, solute-binding protein [Bifidobacterium cuniculi]
MKISRIVSALTVTVFISTALGACGSGGAKGVTDTQADKGLPTMGETVTYDPNHLVNEGKPITIDYWSWNSAGTDPVIDMIDGYTKIHPNVTIKPVNVAWEDYWTKLPLVLKGKNGPAVFNIHNSYDALVRPYAADYDIDAKDLEADYTTASVHITDGKAKYIDSVINTGNIYYNKKLWQEAGLTDADIPTTWDEFREVAKKLAKWDGNKMVQAGFNVNGDAYSAIYEGLNYQKGQVLFDDKGTEPDYDNSVTAENMQFLKDLYDKDRVGSANFGNDYSQSFGNGQSAMVYAWGWLEGTLKEKYPDIEYGVFATPTPSKDTPFAYDRYNGESTPGINANASAEQQAVGQDFVRYLLANDDYVRTAVRELNSFPAKKSLQEDKEILAQPVMAAIAPRVDRLIWPGSMPSTMETSATTAFENVFQNGKSIEQSIKEAQQQMETDMKNSDFVSAENKYAYYDERH